MSRTWETERSRAPDVAVTLDIARPVDEVRAWWVDMPADYVATDPREQPHRIVTRSRTPTRWEIDTYWRGPLGVPLRIGEVFHLREDGWDVDIALPAGLRQRDVFVLAPTPSGTRVTIRAWIWAPSVAARLGLPPMMRYARRSYPRTWRTAARLCERDAPRLHV